MSARLGSGLFLPACALVVAAGCSGRGELLVVGDSGQPGRSGSYDFATVIVGESLTRDVVLRNGGGSPLKLLRIERVGGEGAEVFAVDFQPGTNLPAREDLAFSATFTPPREGPGRYRSTLRVVADDGDREQSVTFELVGLDRLRECEGGRSTIDFGSVVTGEADQRTVFEIANATAFTATVDVNPIEGDGAGAFTLTGGSPQGRFELPPGASRSIVVEFRPVESRTYAASLKLGLPRCGPQVIELSGRGVPFALSWPDRIWCGYVSPGVWVKRPLTFTNIGNSDVLVLGLTTLDQSTFAIVTPPGSDPARLTVPARGNLSVEVACRPLTLGPSQTEIRFLTNVPNLATGTSRVSVFGGGPDIDVSPSPVLDFHKVPVFDPVSPPFATRRRLTISNFGQQPDPSDRRANLKLGQPTWDGGTIPRGVFWITPLNEQTSAADFDFELPAWFDPTIGLPAVIGQNSVTARVVARPTSPGLKRAELTIQSNDPDEPFVSVELVAEAVALPPCNYAVAPAHLDFGILTGSRPRDLAFDVTNRGSNPGEICLLSEVELEEGSHGIFSLPEELEWLELGPAETRRILVRGAPATPPPLGVIAAIGEVSFQISDPATRRISVSLAAQLGPACLLIAPDEIDVGTVAIGCRSATRTFAVYNTCPSAVTVTDFAVQNAPAGDPSCATSAGCELTLLSAPQLPAGGLVVQKGAAPASFSVRYTALRTGADIEAVQLTAQEGSNVVRYVVPVRARGSAVGVHADEFFTDARPKADLLFVIDNSCSMAPKQQTLGDNLAAFAKYAVTAQIEAHAAVTTTDMHNDGGKFVSGQGHESTVVGLGSEAFALKVNVGTNGSGKEEGLAAALAALSPPLVLTDNEGLLRREASLAIVLLADEDDQSPQTVSYYLNGLWNIKGHHLKTMLTFNAVLPLSELCPVFYSPRYQEVADSTNGVKADICAADWASALEALGKTAFGFRTRFFLTAEPEISQGAVEVAIDGVNVPGHDSRGAPIWAYNSVANVVEFEPMYVPEPGQSLTVSYPVHCF